MSLATGAAGATVRRSSVRGIKVAVANARVTHWVGVVLRSRRFFKENRYSHPQRRRVHSYIASTEPCPTYTLNSYP